MYVIFIIGTAGSGKSMLTKAYSEYITSRGSYALTLNLDPGASSLPYTPEIDVRDYVSVEELMEKYGLGPNGALLMANDLIATKISEIRREVEASNPDYVIADTSGQMELFAFRESGPYITRELTNDPKIVIHLFDSFFSRNPLNYVSNLFLASAVHLRITLPHVYVLSKIDLLPPEDISEILRWSESEEELEAAIERNLTGEKMLLSRDIMKAVSSIGLTFELIPVSAKTLEGLSDLHAQITRILRGGEELI